MQNIAAREAKTHFGELLDKAQREPVTIEKHGRPVAVIISTHDYDQLKMVRLREKLEIGENQADKGEFVDYDFDTLTAELDAEE